MRPELENHDAWHNRGYLPHYEAANKYQMITYRLSDSLPSSFDIKSINYEHLSAKERTQYRKYIEALLDQGYGSCLLEKNQVANVVIDTWRFFHQKRYELIAYVVMPNHVHLLIKTYEDWDLGTLVKS